MPSYTTSLRLVQPATGEYSGTWGTQVNNGITALVDTSVAGTATITMTAANYTLSTANGASDEARAAVLSLGGTPGASYQVIVPAVSKLYVVVNATGHAQTVKTASGSGISVPNGATAYLRCNGTDVVTALNYFGSLTLGAALPVASGGTGATTLTGVVKASGTSAFTAGTVSLSSEVTGTLPIANGGTGSTSTTYCSLTANVTGILPIANGGTGSSSTAYCSLTANVTGTLPVANGGTGSTSAQTAINTLAGATTNGQYLRGNGSNVVMSAIQAADITSLNDGTSLATSGTVGATTLGYRGVPQNSQTSAYQLVLADAGKHISITTGGITIPANSVTAFPVGTAISIFNNSGSNQTISITSDTLRLAGNSATGSRTLAQYGLATLLKVSSTVWVASGAGLT